MRRTARKAIRKAALAVERTLRLQEQPDPCAMRYERPGCGHAKAEHDLILYKLSKLVYIDTHDDADNSHQGDHDHDDHDAQL